MTIEAWLSRWCRLEEITGHGRCPTYLFRWTVFQPAWLTRVWPGFGVYVHKFVGDDWSFDLHDHPKRFVSIGLAGAYREMTPCRTHGVGCRRHEVRIFRAPWVRTFPAAHIHLIELLADRAPCWTLVIVLRSVRAWGFWPGGRFWPWRTYVAPDNTVADAARSCV